MGYILPMPINHHQELAMRYTAAFPPVAMHRVPTFYTFDPSIMDDQGNLAESCWGLLSVYLNDAFESIPAALEYYGEPEQPMPALI